MNELFEFFKACISLVNLPYTVLLIGVVLYWLMVIAGALDFDAFDIDVDLDADVDIDVDVDMDMDMDMDMDADVDVDADADVDLHAGGGGACMGLLHFLNVGQVPLMVIISFLVMSLWMASVIGNYYLGTSSLLIALVLFVPNLIIGLLVAKVMTTPLCRIFREASKESEPVEELCGTVGVVISSEVNERFGQVEVSRKGSLLKLNAISRDGETLQHGDYALLLRFDKAAGIYLVEKSDSPV